MSHENPQRSTGAGPRAAALALSALLLAAAPLAVRAQLRSTTTPAVRLADPSRLELTPDGAPFEVALEGTDLTLFTQALVEVGGQASLDFTAALRHDARLGRTFVTLAAAPKAAGLLGELVLTDGRTRLPVTLLAISVAKADPPPLLLGLSVDRPAVDGGQGIRITATLDRSAGTAGASIRILYPAGVIDGDQALDVPPGAQEGTLLARVYPVEADRTVTLNGALDGVTLDVDVLVRAPRFTPLALSSPALAFRGRRFSPVAFAAPALSFTGRRFTPVTLTAPALSFTGRRFTLLSLRSGSLIFTGTRGDVR